MELIYSLCNPNWRGVLVLIEVMEITVADVLVVCLGSTGRIAQIDAFKMELFIFYGYILKQLRVFMMIF